jgi:hypothetical protein
MAEDSFKNDYAVLDDPSSTPDQLESAAMRLFEEGAFAAARRGFSLLLERGAAKPDHIETLATLLVESGDVDLAMQMLLTYLDQDLPNLDPLARTSLTRVLFELSTQVGEPALRQDAALRWLNAIAEEGDNAWLPLLDPAIRDLLDASFPEPQDELEWFELLAFAPPATGLKDLALGLIEEFGHRHAADSSLAREAERLLHALGAPEAAYRVEQTRRSLAPKKERTTRKPPEDDEFRLNGWVIAIAGGHPAMRQFIRNDLTRAGAKEVREIPPRWEASRSGREIAALLSGVDVAVMIGRHIAHSTVDQVKRGAEQARVPVITSLTVSASGVRRALALHAKSGRLDKP